MKKLISVISIVFLFMMTINVGIASAVNDDGSNDTGVTSDGNTSTDDNGSTDGTNSDTDDSGSTDGTDSDTDDSGSTDTNTSTDDNGDTDDGTPTDEEKDGTSTDGSGETDTDTSTDGVSIEKEEDETSPSGEGSASEDDHAIGNEGDQCAPMIGVICKRPLYCKIDKNTGNGYCTSPIKEYVKRHDYLLRLTWGNVYKNPQEAENFSGKIQIRGAKIIDVRPILFEGRKMKKIYEQFKKGTTDKREIIKDINIPNQPFKNGPNIRLRLNSLDTLKIASLDLLAEDTDNSNIDSGVDNTTDSNTDDDNTDSGNDDTESDDNNTELTDDNGEAEDNGNLDIEDLKIDEDKINKYRKEGFIDRILKVDRHHVVWKSMAGPHIDGIVLRVVGVDKEKFRLKFRVGTEIEDTFVYEDLKEKLPYTEEYKTNSGLGAVLKIHRASAKVQLIKQQLLEEVRVKLKDEDNAEHVQDIFENIDEEDRDDIKKNLLKLKSDDLENIVKGWGEYETELKPYKEYLRHIPKAKKIKWMKSKVNLIKLLRRLKALRNKFASEGVNINELDTEDMDSIYGDITSEVEATAETLIKADEEGADKEEIEKVIRKLGKSLRDAKLKSLENKFKDKIIPFKDTNDKDWYTKYVKVMSDKGIVSGYKDKAGNLTGEYGPSNNVTVAEILKISLNVALDKVQDEGVPGNIKAKKHWAKKFFRKAEKLGLDLVKDKEMNPDRSAKRGEVIRAILEAYAISPDEVSSYDFSDVKNTHNHAKWIYHAKKLGLISGDAGKNTYRPDDPINRAEIAKIINLIIELQEGADEAIEEEELTNEEIEKALEDVVEDEKDEE